MEESVGTTAQSLKTFLERFPEQRQLIFCSLVDYYQITRANLVVRTWQEANPGMSDEDLVAEIVNFTEAYGTQWFLETNQLKHNPNNFHNHTLAVMERSKRAKELGANWSNQIKQELKRTML